MESDQAGRETIIAPDGLFRFYRGSSMLAVFRPGDYLIHQGTAFKSLRPGDVVLFRRPGSTGDEGQDDDVVVHRVIAVLAEGLVTRGDTNSHPDGWRVTPEVLLGKVIALERHGKRRPVLGGRLGFWQAGFNYTLHRMRRAALRMLHSLGRPAWRWLRARRIVPHLWQPAIRQARFAARDGWVIKYICGGQVVARWWPETGRFHCIRPYDLVIPDPRNIHNA
jgi:hypothetical protein